MKKKIIIFGAGIWGRIAYEYYCDKCEILCFLDNNQVLWGTTILGIKIEPPDVLKEIEKNSYTIVIANQHDWKEIQEQLFFAYCIDESIRFRAEIGFDVLRYQNRKTSNFNEEELIIKYQGGLGNQMFQYALAHFFEQQGERVTADVSVYKFIDKREFELKNIFPNITLEECNYSMKEVYRQNEKCWITEKKRLCFSNEVLKQKVGYISGFWQSYRYAELIKDDLREKFVFCKKKDSGLDGMLTDVRESNSVSLHIRRGDYLGEKEKKTYGNICTLEYYRNAIRYITEHSKNVIFFVFSDDIEWVKNNFRIENAVYIGKEQFEDYENWYDMYLMSNCKHNIIANSSFSWWGAWLNANSQKLVIAPEKWFNTCDEEQICPKNWIRLSGG